MLRDADYQVQSSVIDALVQLADASAVPQLIELLGDDFDLARRAAVEVLNAVATPEAIQDLVRALGDEDWWVRARAADALGSLGGEKVVLAAAGLLQVGGELALDLLVVRGRLGGRHAPRQRQQRGRGDHHRDHPPNACHHAATVPPDVCPLRL